MTTFEFKRPEDPSNFCRRSRQENPYQEKASRWRYSCALITLLTTIHQFSCHSKKSNPHMSSEPSKSSASDVEIHYMSDVGWIGSKSAIFSYTGESLLKVTFSYDLAQEIGFYAGAVDATNLRTAHRVLEKSRYLDHPTGNIFPPETKFVSFREERQGSSPLPLRSFPKNNLPPTLLAPIAQFEALVESLRHHPRRALKATGRLAKLTCTTDEDIELAFHMDAVGTEPMSAGNPLVNEEDAKAKLSLTISALNDPNRRATVELRREHLVSGDRGDAPLLRLVPGQRWSVVLAKRMHLSPGPYDVHLSYRSFDVAEPGHVEGEIPIPLGTLTVTPAR
jgi:hypothetical protein